MAAQNQLKEKMALIRKRVLEKANRGQLAAANKLLELSQEIVPVETSALHDSGHTRSEGSGATFRAIAGYAGEDFNNNSPVVLIGSKTGLPIPADRRPSEYAAIVHFDPLPNHGDKEFRFLLVPLERDLEEIQQAFVEEVLK